MRESALQHPGKYPSHPITALSIAAIAPGPNPMKLERVPAGPGGRNPWRGRLPGRSPCSQAQPQALCGPSAEVSAPPRPWKRRPRRARLPLRPRRRQAAWQGPWPRVAKGARGGRGESRPATRPPRPLNGYHSWSICSVWAPAPSHQPQQSGCHCPHFVDGETKAHRACHVPGSLSQHAGAPDSTCRLSPACPAASVALCHAALQSLALRREPTPPAHPRAGVLHAPNQ